MVYYYSVPTVLDELMDVPFGLKGYGVKGERKSGESF